MKSESYFSYEDLAKKYEIPESLLGDIKTENQKFYINDPMMCDLKNLRAVLSWQYLHQKSNTTL